jgi:hypothetical protein
MALRYHTENGMKVVRTGEGEIVAEVNGEEQHRYLDNLVRLLHSGNRASWPQIVTEHFDKLRDHRPAYNYLFKDFEYAAPLLRVLIKGQELYKNDLETFVYRKDFPGTNTFLVLEYEQQFRYLTKTDIAEWAKPEEELFAHAIANTPAHEVEIKEYTYCGKFPVFIFFSGDYSASMMLDLNAKSDFAVGTYGSLIAIPTKGTAFVHPIESGDITELVGALTPTVEKFYNEDPGSITTNFYWRPKKGATWRPFILGKTLIL